MGSRRVVAEGGPGGAVCARWCVFTLHGVPPVDPKGGRGSAARTCWGVFTLHGVPPVEPEGMHADPARIHEWQQADTSFRRRA
jgi:hypothetical protein